MSKRTTKKLILSLVSIIVIAALIVFGVVLHNDHTKYEQGISSYFYHAKSTYTQNETLQFGDITVYLTRARVIKDSMAGIDSEVDVNFVVHNNTQNTVSLAGYHFQVYANQGYDWVDQNSFQYGFLAPNSSQQNYFVAHIGAGYTEPFTLVVSKGGITKSIVIDNPQIETSQT